MGVFHTTIVISLFYTSFAAPQQPEISDQFEITNPVTEQPVEPSSAAVPIKEHQVKIEMETHKPVEEEIVTENKKNDTRNEIIVPEIGISVKIYKFISEPIIKAVNAPRVHAVLRNIGTCVVNGAMELFSYYLPAPLMPLIASAAGLVIPFEPVVMLKEKMPVTSYRRAFQTAMNTFLGTFDKFKIDDDYDPYMTRRFNRRFMSDDKKKTKKNTNLEIVEF